MKLKLLALILAITVTAQYSFVSGAHAVELPQNENQSTLPAYSEDLQNQASNNVENRNDVLQLTSAVQTPPQPPASQEQTVLSNQEVSQRLIELGEFTQTEYNTFLQQLSFEDVYDHMSSTDFLNLVATSGILNDSRITDAGSLKQALKNKGIDIDALQLKPDGIIQALANPVGGSLLKWPETDKAAASKAKEAINQIFQRDKAVFLENLNTTDYLSLLGAKLTPDQSAYDPFFGLEKFISVLDKNELDSDYLSRSYNIGDLFLGITNEQAILAELAKPSNIQKVISYLNGLGPDVPKLLYFGGALLYDMSIPDSLNPSIEFDPLRDANGRIIKDSQGNILYSPWMDSWQAIAAKRVDTFMQAFLAAGGSVDYVMIDYEEKNSANYEMNAQNYLGSNVLKPGFGKTNNIWTALMQDPRSAVLLEEMGVTKDEFLNSLDRNGNLLNDSVMAQKWNIVQERRRVLGFYNACVVPTQKYFPNVVMGSFEDGFRTDLNPNGHNHTRYTNMWGGLGGLDAAGVSGLLSSDGLREIDFTDTPFGEIHPDGSSFNQLIGLTSIIRSTAQVSEQGSLHWLSGPDYYIQYGAANSVLPYFAELMFHTALNGSDHLFLQTSSWSTLAGHEYVDTVLRELNDPNLVAYTDRAPITLDNLNFNENLLVSGMRVTNDRAQTKDIYRVSWASGGLSSVLINDGTNGQPLQFRSGDSIVTIPGGRIYVPAGGEVQTFNPGGSTHTTTGAWVIVDDISTGKILNQNIDVLLAQLSKPPIPAAISGYIDELRASVPAGYTVSDPVETTVPGKYKVTMTATGNVSSGQLQSTQFTISATNDGKPFISPSSVQIQFKNISTNPDGAVLFTGMQDLENVLDATANAVNPTVFASLAQIKVTAVSADKMTIHFDYQGQSYVRVGMLYNDPNNGMMKRTGWVHFPNNNENAADLSLVLSFHGGFGNGAQQMMQTGMNADADANGYAVVYLDGYGASWNAVIDTAAAKRNIDDVGFVDAFLDSFVEKYHLDASKIFATGISNGGQMVYRLASEARHPFAGIALISSGITDFSQFHPSYDLPILVIHGSLDAHIPYNGGVGPNQATHGDYVSVPDLTRYLLESNGLSPTAVGAAYQPYPGLSSSKIVAHEWGSGANEVNVITVISGVHTWFGGNFASEIPGSPAYHIFSANQALFQFFNDHSSIHTPGGSGGEEEIPGIIQNYVNGLQSQFMGLQVSVNKDQNASQDRYLVIVSPVSGASLNKGDFQSLSFYVDVNLDKQFIGVNYVSIPGDKPNPQDFLTGLQNIPYGKEDPLVMMTKIVFENVTIGKDGIEYANFKLNGELWRIYKKDNTVRIGKRRPQDVINYQNALQQGVGPDFIVTIFPDNTQPGVFNGSIERRQNSQDVASLAGSFVSMTYTFNKDVITGKLSFNNDSVVLNYSGLSQKPDVKLLNDGISVLGVKDIFVYMSQIRIVSLQVPGTIIYTKDNFFYKIYRDEKGIVRNIKLENIAPPAPQVPQAPSGIEQQVVDETVLTPEVAVPTLLDQTVTSQASAQKPKASGGRRAPKEDDDSFWTPKPKLKKRF